MRAYRQKRKDAGLCIECGTCPPKFRTGGRCENCLDKKSKRGLYHVPEERELLLEKKRIFSRSNWLQTTYGISPDVWFDLASKQKWLCAICGKKPRKLFTDHDHKTNKVRGLLCPDCNKMLGFAYDDTTILTTAIKYVIKHSGDNNGRNSNTTIPDINTAG
jgi:hypothetical protein